MRLVLVGTSHHHAPVELRERVALDRERGAALAERLAAEGGEAVVLSTCNRTELYVAAPDIDAAQRAAVAALAELEPEVEPALYRLRERPSAAAAGGGMSSSRWKTASRSAILGARR